MEQLQRERQGEKSKSHQVLFKPTALRGQVTVSHHRRSGIEMVQFKIYFTIRNGLICSFEAQESPKFPTSA